MRESKGVHSIGVECCFAVASSQRVNEIAAEDIQGDVERSHRRKVTLDSFVLLGFQICTLRANG